MRVMRGACQARWMPGWGVTLGGMNTFGNTYTRYMLMYAADFEAVMITARRRILNMNLNLAAGPQLAVCHHVCVSHP